MGERRKSGNCLRIYRYIYLARELAQHDDSTKIPSVPAGGLGKRRGAGDTPQPSSVEKRSPDYDLVW